ncbi:M4 family metallopeptidase [Amnibacterium flavum]|uniref:Neutral metalloproteinase n=1 Tax=Amnibacterium flavum TaxID=2173173 RepID=A0A2V1HQW7_9MICO|nr:M4 family metallopeptidase [Amnibacterium flavum]PVZ94945.1 peptidase M4 family protein [Amnibacterium flavum]
MHRSIVPPYLLARIAENAGDRAMPAAARAAQRALLSDGPVRLAGARAPRYADFGRGGAAASGPQRTIHDAESTETVPGVVVRREADPATGDPAADEAYDGLGATYALFASAYGRDSIDGNGLALDATVHYGDEYDNAFWDGERMVFGDGDGEIFRRFTVSLSVIGHELAHGVTQFSADLPYQGQSGALNESVSDVFGSLVEQHSRQQTAAEASWLIGEGLFTDAVEGRALRSMSAPGTAYDDDVLGRDPQPAHMDFFVDTLEDNGGVHINSGIPNRAFHLAATAIGGFAWEGAGAVWYDTLTRGSISGETDFDSFAAATVRVARARWGRRASQSEAVVDAWRTVGVEPEAAR